MNPDQLCLSCMADRGEASICPHCGQGEPKPDASGHRLAPGTVVGGKYLLGRVLGQGGFGITYLGWDLKLERKLAVKEYFPREFATRAKGAPQVVPFSGESRDHFKFGFKKFLLEGRSLVQFQHHPGIVSGLDFLEANDTAYLVMEYVDGQTLDAFLGEQPTGRLPVATAVGIMMQVMDALRELHQGGLVHRDISPDNIYITASRQVKLLDFGSARHALREHSHSIDVVVKRGYSPFEQYQARGKIGAWTDIYATAATLYRALVGESPPDSAERVSEDRLLPPSQRGIAMPEAAERALLRALAIDPTDRLRTIEDLQQPLFALSRSPAQELPGPSPPPPKPAPPAGATEPVVSRRPPADVTVPVVTKPSLPSPPPPAGPVTYPQPEPRRWTLVAAGTLILLLLLAGGWALQKAMDRDEQPVTGTLVLRLDPPAYATLDDEKKPEAADERSPVHRFSDLKARTYRLKVWSEGYELKRQRVTIRAGETTEIRVQLDRQ